MEVRGIGADLPAAISLPDLRLAEPLARLVGDHERRVDEQDSITVSGCAIRPADRLLDAACSARVEDLAVPVDNRHAGLIGHKVGTAFPPGKVNTDEPSTCHTEVVPHPYSARGTTNRCGDNGDRERRSPTVFGGA
jgi:hypothetical protein